MVHIYCLNDACRRAAHLISEEYWNFKGKVKCVRCGYTMEIQIKKGKIVSVKRPNKNLQLYIFKS